MRENKKTHKQTTPQTCLYSGFWESVGIGVQRRVRTAVVAAFFSPGGFSYKVNVYFGLNCQIRHFPKPYNAEYVLFTDCFAISFRSLVFSTLCVGSQKTLGIFMKLLVFLVSV